MEAASPQEIQQPSPRQSFVRRCHGLVREILEPLRLDPRAVVACCVASAVLIVMHYHGKTASFRAYFPNIVAGGTPLRETLPYLYWFLAGGVMQFLVPVLAVRLTPGIRLRDTGLGLGDWRFGLKVVLIAFLVFLPAVFIASRFPAFASHYPMSVGARKGLDAFIVYQIGYALSFFSWEYLFRGYLLFSLRPVMGNLAILVQTIPFAVLHFGKPELEAYGSIVAGLFLGALAIRTRSCLYGILLHVAVALTMDLLAAGPTLASLP